MHITLTEDDIDLGQAVADHLRALGHAVEWLKTADHTRKAVLSGRSDARYGTHLVLLDLGLPDLPNGMNLLRELRQHSHDLPILVISARDQIRERIEGLAAGADDYLVKPSDLDELSARIEAVARRYALTPAPQLILAGGAQIDFAACIARHPPEAVVALTAKEWSMLRCLASRPGHAWSKESLAHHLYERGSGGDSNTLEVLVSRLRRKLGPDSIVTMRQLGYRLELSPEEPGA